MRRILAHLLQVGLLLLEQVERLLALRGRHVTAPSPRRRLLAGGRRACAFAARAARAVGGSLRAQPLLQVVGLTIELAHDGLGRRQAQPQLLLRLLPRRRARPQQLHVRLAAATKAINAHHLRGATARPCAPAGESAAERCAARAAARRRRAHRWRRRRPGRLLKSPRVARVSASEALQLRELRHRGAQILIARARDDGSRLAADEAHARALDGCAVPSRPDAPGRARTCEHP